MEFLEKLSLAGLVPVIAVNDADDAVPLCKALAEGGLPVAEITFRTAWRLRRKPSAACMKPCPMCCCARARC